MPGRELPIGARVALVMLTVIWGLSWPIMRVALAEIPPFSFRVLTSGLGALTLISYAKFRGDRMAVTVGMWHHIVVASLLNIVGFAVLGSVAQLLGATGRVAVVIYSMPVWVALFARLILGESLTAGRMAALGLCVAGLVALMVPQLHTGGIIGILLALASGVSWAAGTVYLKWAKLDVEPLVLTAWQLMVAFVVILALAPIFDPRPPTWHVHPGAVFGVLYSGIIAVGFANAIWFNIITRVPAGTAALGIVSVPMIGVITSMYVLDEFPTKLDIVGFALIVAASACALLGSWKRPAR